MSELKTLIDKIASGSLDVTKAVPEFQKIVVTADPNRPAGALSYEDRERRRMEDDNDYENTFSEVVAAWVGGQLSDEQFGVLRAAATPEGATTGFAGDAGAPAAEEPPEAGGAPIEEPK